MLSSMLHSDNLKFSMVQWFFWSGTGIFFSFIAVYFQYIDFSSIQIGFSMSVISVTPIIGLLYIGILTDKIGSIVPVLLTSLGLSILCLGALFLFELHYLIIVGLCACVALFVQPLPSLIDSWTLEVKKVITRLDYGFSRAMGSVGYSLTVVLIGMIYDRWGIQLIFPAAAIVSLMTACLIFFVHKTTKTADHQSVRVNIRLKEFFSAPMISVLIFSCITFTAIRAAQIFLPVLIVDIGGTTSDLGFGLGIMALSEVPFMVASTWLIIRYSDTKILFVSLLFFMLRIFVHAIAPTPAWVIAAQALQGPSFGLFLPSFVHLLNRLSPEGTKTFAQTTGNLATFGLGSVIGGALGGLLVNWFGIINMYLILTGIMAISVIGYFLSQKILKY